MESSNQRGNILMSSGNSTNILNLGYVTIPRYKVTTDTSSSCVTSASTVVMRRSASVPCKHRDCDSTSSGGSDSGVSTGSPRQSVTDEIWLQFLTNCITYYFLIHMPNSYHVCSYNKILICTLFDFINGCILLQQRL